MAPEPVTEPGQDYGARILQRDLRNALRRILKQLEIDAVNPPDGRFEHRVRYRIRMLYAKSIRVADQVPEGHYAVEWLRAELGRRESEVT